MGDGASCRHDGGLTDGVRAYVGSAGFQESHTGVNKCRAEREINAGNDLDDGLALS